MKLYFTPLACSLATRIALYEAGADAQYVEVDGKSKRTADGHDYRAIHALGMVPALGLDDGELLTENAAILQFVAKRFPDADLGARDERERTALHQWLCFIGTELHKGIFALLLDRTASDDVKAHGMRKVETRFRWVAEHLEGREFLLDHFTVADAYLYTVFNWTAVTTIDLKLWPALAAWYARIAKRPSVHRAFVEERALYMAEMTRHANEAAATATTSARA